MNRRTVDVILCANVCTTPACRAALARMRELLRRRRLVVFIETTRDNHQI